jgi:hypothetical protein
MAQTYQVGGGASPITLKVTVGTVGFAYTSVSLVRGTTSKSVAESSPKDGNIPQTVLGIASAVQNSSTVIMVLINFSHLNAQQRESALDAISVDYEFDGGVAGKKNYTFDKNTDLIVTPNKKIVAITTEIQLI